MGSQRVGYDRRTEQQFDLNSIKIILLRNHSIWISYLACHQYLCKYESNQSVLKEINPEYSLEGLMLKLKLQYFDHLVSRVNLLEKTLMLGKTEGRRRRGWERMKMLDNITDSMGMNLSKSWEIVKDRGAWHAAVHGFTTIWILAKLSNNNKI